MADKFKKLYHGQLGSTSGALYTCTGVGKTTIIKGIRVINTDSSARWFKLWDGAASDSLLILPQTTLAAGGLLLDDGVICMEAGGVILGQGEVAAKITVAIYGLEMT